MKLTWYIPFLAALIPLITGFIWYHPKVFGNAWMAASGVTPDTGKKPNMALVFGLTYLFSILMAFIIAPIAIHQFGFASMMESVPGIHDATSENGAMFNSMMEKYGTNFRTFKHGSLHGTITGLFLVMPVIAINAMFERKGFKYIAINSGYWIVSFALMGGVLCGFL
jgi:uncharacterized protein DUF1761